MVGYEPMSVTTGMVGQGFYNRNSAPQLAAINHVLPWAEAAISQMEFDESTPTIGFADFGCSEGRNSIEAMKRLVRCCRGRTGRPIQTIHSDLPTNDFSELFLRLRPSNSSVFGATDVFSSTVGGSMFDQLLPPRSVHFATTFNAIGFLGRRPVDRLPGYILPNGPSKIGGIGAVSKEDHAIFATQANADLEAFSLSRARELVPGGKLLIEVFGAGEHFRTCDGIYDVLNDALLEVLAADLIDKNSYESFYQPVYFRTLEELTEPFSNGDSPVKQFYHFDQAECYSVAVPFVETFQDSGDVAQFASDYTDFLRAFTEPVLRKSFCDHPSLEMLIADVYQRAERLICDDPDRYAFHYVSNAVLLTRTGIDVPDTT